MGRLAHLEHACPLPVPGRRPLARAFASGLDWSHWDYPLLLPLSIARGWNYMGGESLPVPAVMAFLFTFLTLGLLWSALCLLRSRSQGYLAAMVLMGTPFFIVMGASQFADIPLGLLHPGDPRPALLPGAVAGESPGRADPGRARRRIVRLDEKRGAPVSR